MTDIAPLTADEARMLQENGILSRMVDQAQHAGEWGDFADLLDRQLLLEDRFRKSRTRTWDAWMSTHYLDGKPPWNASGTITRKEAR